ncbi:MAG: hypothetical protein ACI87V_002016, partial [Flavobacteriales bacterium]
MGALFLFKNLPRLNVVATSSARGNTRRSWEHTALVGTRGS